MCAWCLQMSKKGIGSPGTAVKMVENQCVHAGNLHRSSARTASTPNP